jgi:hypothetical protein
VLANASGDIINAIIVCSNSRIIKDITEKTIMVIKFLLKRYQEVLRISKTEKG